MTYFYFILYFIFKQVFSFKNSFKLCIYYSKVFDIQKRNLLVIDTLHPQCYDTEGVTG